MDAVLNVKHSEAGDFRVDFSIDALDVSLLTSALSASRAQWFQLADH
jgi:hypothetical protein